MLYNIIDDWRVNTIEETIEFAQSDADKQISPLISSSGTFSQHQNGDDNSVKNSSLLEEFRNKQSSNFKQFLPT